MDMNKVARILKMGFAIALALGVGFCTYNFGTAERRVKELCPQIRPGMALAELRSFARQHGLGPGDPREGLNFLVERKSYGRHGCRVAVKSGLVQESSYLHND